MRFKKIKQKNTRWKHILHVTSMLKSYFCLMRFLFPHTHTRPPTYMVKETDDAKLHLFIDIQMAGDFGSLLTPSQGQVCGYPSKQTMTHKLMDHMK